MEKTIFAPATLVGRSGVAVIRISGPNALTALQDLGVATVPTPNVATLSKIFAPGSSEMLDEGLIIYFKAPHSFTGEDVVELQLHGSMAVIIDTLEALTKLPYLRPAEPGEFAKRAFMNNKIDLTRAEGLALLIDAQTPLQRKVALGQLHGNLASLYDGWRTSIVEALARVEALIDFPDDDIPESELLDVYKRINDIIEGMEGHLKTAEKGEALFEGVRVAIVGPPNAGKSSLLNALAKRDVAIVSDIPGTTRDIIEVRINLHGYPVSFLDTAGIRETADMLEMEGIRRSRRAMEEADVTLFMWASASPIEKSVLHEYIKNTASPMLILNKADEISFKSFKKCAEFVDDNVLEISVKTGLGIDNLLDKLSGIIKEKYGISSGVIITNMRYKSALLEALEHLQLFYKAKTLELAAEDLRVAASAIGRITGKISVDELLDEVFSNFCIGK